MHLLERECFAKNFMMHAVGHNVGIGMALSGPTELEDRAKRRQSKNIKMTFENLQTPDFFGWMGRPGMRSFDHEIIRSRLSELKSIRQKGDAHELLYYFSEGIHGNMAGMGTPEIYESNDNHEAYGIRFTAYCFAYV